MTTITTDIRTLKRRARQTELGIALGLAWLMLDVIHKLPRLVRIALGIALAYGVLWAYRHPLWILAAITGLLTFKVARAAWIAHTWERVAPREKTRTHYELAHGLWHERETHDDIPF